MTRRAAQPKVATHDAIGAFRTMDWGKPVNAADVIVLPSGGEKPFANARELMRILASSDDVGDCVVRQWVRFAHGRAEVEADEPSIAHVRSAFTKSSLDLRELLVAIATSPSFLNRAPSPGEVLR